MKMAGKFLFFGTGSSLGVPVIGCECAVCRSESPFNKRLRSSGLIKIHDKQIVIDCGPDFRTQMLHHHIKQIDGLILTHAHYDHTGGFDELRILNARSKQPIPCLLAEATAEELKMRFPYAFEQTSSPEKLTTRSVLHYLKSERGKVNFLGLPIHYVTYQQGGMLVNGFKVGNFAYISDIRHYPQTIFEDLQGVETLVVSCLRQQSSPLHFNVQEAIDFAYKVGADQAWFTHIAHELEHDLTNSKLPPNYQLAYDGLEIDFEIPLNSSI
ncbi:hypothetical protein NEOC84_001604|nr:hypothetical protein [Neochlamydia sp. AcF84]